MNETHDFLGFQVFANEKKLEKTNFPLGKIEFWMGSNCDGFEILFFPMKNLFFRNYFHWEILTI